jgi:high-affinity iron transporter
MSLPSPRQAGLAAGALVVLAALVWVAATAGGNPDPGAPHLSHGAVIVNSGLLVFREGLETILVLAAVTASMVGDNQGHRRPVAGGAGVAFLATIATWFVVIALISAINAPALDIQAGTGLLAIAVLLVIMNWFFHKVYWTSWISHHNKRRRNLMALGGDARSRLTLGLAMLGFTSIYREGFEVVLFLQSLRLQAGSLVVLEGAAIGLVLTGIVGALTFVAHHRLPYKKMLVLTGVMLAGVLVVMVGESGQEMQLAGWIPTTRLPLPIPGWIGLWLAVFPTAETLIMQAVAGVLVIGSYFVSRYLRVWRPQRLDQAAGRRAAAGAR